MTVVAVGVLAGAAAACGAESPAEELFAIPVERHAVAGGNAEVPGSERHEGEMVAAEIDPDTDAAAAAGTADADDRPGAPGRDVEPGDAATAGEGNRDARPEPSSGAGDAAGGSNGSSHAADRGGDTARGNAGGSGDAGTPAAQPSDRAIADFVAAQTRRAVASDHRVVDVTLDGTRDVVVGILTVGGGVELVVGRWDGHSVDESGRVRHPDGTRLGSLVVRDLDGDGRLEILLPHVDHPHRRVLVASVAPAGKLAVPTACPVPAPATHAFDFGSGAEAVQLVCAPKERGGGDGLVWSDGIFAGAAGAAKAGRGSDA